MKETDRNALINILCTLEIFLLLAFVLSLTIHNPIPSESKMVKGIYKKTYVTSDGVIHNIVWNHDTHNYHIDKPFTCDHITFYLDFESYSKNCGVKG